MVRAVTSFGRSGLSDWLLQRFTAVVLLAYVLCVGGILLLTPGIDFATWRSTRACRSPSIRTSSKPSA